jgi:hypothetical protein
LDCPFTDMTASLHPCIIHFAVWGHAGCPDTEYTARLSFSQCVNSPRNQHTAVATIHVRNLFLAPHSFSAPSDAPLSRSLLFPPSLSLSVYSFDGWRERKGDCTRGTGYFGGSPCAHAHTEVARQCRGRLDVIARLGEKGLSSGSVWDGGFEPCALDPGVCLVAVCSSLPTGPRMYTHGQMHRWGGFGRLCNISSFDSVLTKK